MFREIVNALPGNTALQNKALVTANETMNTFNAGDLALRFVVLNQRSSSPDDIGMSWNELEMSANAKLRCVSASPSICSGV